MNGDTKPTQAILSLVKLGRNDEWHSKSGVPKITKLLPNKDSITIGCPSGEHQPDVCMKSISKKIKISPYHAIIQRESDSGFTIIDKSKFGTYLNYVRVKGRMRLENGDIICFGCAKGFRIRPGQEIDKKSSDLKYMVSKYLKLTVII
ncbi:unnamed protein product [Rodentolepis nana]|uniref:FHA domain-containing protein n=1 Tax=Rodentolepis nana TaxID=102285 RepID=A0A0R3TKY0_RODNA|nr:unnamed protein product [Rodentolepis nana]